MAVGPLEPAAGAAPPLSVSVVVPASRPEALRRLLASLAAAARPAGFECLVVLNGRDEECAAAAAEHADRLPGLRALPAPPPRSLGRARNAALAEAGGRWLCFLDDDVRVPPGYFQALAEACARHPGAAVIGGPNLTPEGSGPLQRWCGHLLASPLCAGPMSRRYRPEGAEPFWTDDAALILCNLAVDRRALAEDGLRFDETLVRNEENLLLEQLRARGRRALFVPALAVEHERRDSARAFAVQCFLSGRGRAEMTLKRPSSLRPHPAAPSLLALGALAFAARPAALAPLAAAYAAACALNAAWLSVRNAEGLSGAAAMALLGPLAQLSYGAGFLAGLLSGAGAASTAQGQLGAPRSQRQAISRTEELGK